MHIPIKAEIRIEGSAVLPAQAAQPPRLDWQDHRRIVEDVSGALSKNWRFKAQVCALVIVLCGAILSLVTLVIGGRIIDSQIALAEGGLTNKVNALSSSVDSKLGKVDQQVEDVRTEVRKRIADEFKEERIQATIQSVATTAAANIIKQNVQPAEATVAERLDNFATFLDDRKKQYDADLVTFRKELEILSKRNRITALADRAIGNGSLSDWKRLNEMFENEADGDVKTAEMAETFRVVSAFSLFSPSRALGVTLNVSKINSNKNNESELTSDELTPFLRQTDPLTRARVAILLADKPHTFALAQALATALDRDDNLEALRFEKQAFARITGFAESKGLDATGELKWWSENIERLRKELPP